MCSVFSISPSSHHTVASTYPTIISPHPSHTHCSLHSQTHLTALRPGAGIWRISPSLAYSLGCMGTYQVKVTLGRAKLNIHKPSPRPPIKATGLSVAFF